MTALKILVFDEDPSPALTHPFPALFIPLPANILSYKRAPSIPNNILRNPPFCSLISFPIVSTPFNNKPETSRDLSILIMSFISSFDIISFLLC